MARPRTGKHGMPIAVSSPQPDGILILRDRFDKPEIIIAIPPRNKKFYMRCGWAKIGEGYEKPKPP